MAKSAPKPRLEPLYPRPGSAFTCFADGLCCTNIHGLGPVTKGEEQELLKWSDDPVIRDDEGEVMLRTVESGACNFQMDDALCRIHAEAGLLAKPEGCRRFPYRLTATPDGGRVTTHHRCPCRTMGDRPDVDLDDARSVLKTGNGRLRPDATIDKKVPLKKGKSVSFEQWKKMEADMLTRLEAGDDPIAVLNVEPFPTIRGQTWKQAAEEMLENENDGSNFDAALLWFAQGLLEAVKGTPIATEVRPWQASYDRAEKRDGERSGREVLNDWVADELWSMEWAVERDLRHAMLDWATRLAVADRVRARIEALGASEGRAAAEALTVIDAVGESGWWEDVVDTMVV